MYDVTACQREPEIYRVAQKLSKALSNKKVLSIEFGLDRLKGWEEVLINSMITSVRSHGKAMLISTDSDTQFTVIINSTEDGISASRKPLKERQIVH